MERADCGGGVRWRNRILPHRTGRQPIFRTRNGTEMSAKLESNVPERLNQYETTFSCQRLYPGLSALRHLRGAKTCTYAFADCTRNTCPDSCGSKYRSACQSRAEKIAFGGRCKIKSN